MDGAGYSLAQDLHEWNNFPIGDGNLLFPLQPL